jgi:iron complex outermembrane receptor protein
MRATTLVPVAAALACGIEIGAAQAQTSPPPVAPAPPASAAITTLPAVSVRASADASAQGLSPAYPGGQVARGGRAGILGTHDAMATPFSVTSYTNELIQDRQARSVGEVLQNDAGVRVARGFGNFQESYFIRGFILGSDDVAYNGLYSLLPRQYIATELFERVEVLRGASAFLNGATPGGGGLGGAINLLPKRAGNEALTRVTLDVGSGERGGLAVDVGRRFGPDGATGVRFNAAWRDGGTAVDDEQAQLGVVSLGLDWRSRDVRLSGDIGWQDNQLSQTRPSVSLGAVTRAPDLPGNDGNFAQPWTHSNERDLFGTLRGEWDLNDRVTAYAAYGLRRSDEDNRLAGLDVSDAQTGAATTYRFDNTREDRVDTAELGVRGTLKTGSVGHEWVASTAYFELESKNAYGMDFFNALATNLYTPTRHALPAWSGGEFRGGDLAAPGLTTRIRMSSLALGDTLALLDEQLLVTLGARYQKLHTQSFDYDTGAGVAPYDDSRTSPVAAVVWRIGKQLSAYGNYIEGLVQGDTASAPFGSPPPVNNGEMLAPYVSKQKEIGLKYDSGRLAATAALFSTRKPRALINADNVYTSEGEDRHDGLELNVYGVAAPGLKLLGGVTWLDAEQKSTGNPAADGKRVIGVPEWQSNLGVEWDLAILPGLALDARLVTTGSSYADAINTLKVPGWTRLDLGVRWLTEVQGRLLTLRARLDNATDKDYWASVGGYPGSGYLVVGAPRAFNLSASVDF